MSKYNRYTAQPNSTDNLYLNAIRNNDNKVLKELYKLFYPSIVSLVRSKGGTDEDASDVFQDALIVIYKKLSKDELVLTASFKAYLNGVCKMIWLKRSSRKRIQLVSNSESALEHLSEEPNVDFMELDKTKFLYEKLDLMTAQCQSILLQTLNRVKGVDIAAEMGYTIEYVKRKRYKCKQKLIELIKSDSRYKNYL